EGNVPAQGMPMSDLDATDGRDIIDFRLRKIVGRLVGSDAIFVETARLGPGFKDRDIVSIDGQAMCTSKPGRPGPHDRHLAAGRLRPGVKLLGTLHRLVGSVTLQPTDLDRLALGCLANADFFTKRLGRT